MLKARLIMVALMACAMLGAEARAHGGAFTGGQGGGNGPSFGGGIGGGTGEPGPGGPGDPRGGGTGGATGNPSGGNSGPRGPAAPVRPGGGLPTAGGFGRGASTPRGKKGPSNTGLAWTLWWDLNEERFLNLKAKVRSLAASSDNSDSFVDAHGDDEIAELSLRDIRSGVLPALLVAAKDDFYDTRAAAVIALGKTADASHLDVYSAILDALDDKDNRVRESACLGLGLLGSNAAIPVLMDIANNHVKARRRLGRGTSDILHRTRMFASVAIGLIGASASLQTEGTAESQLLAMLSKPATHRDLRVGPALALQLAASRSTIPQLIGLFADREGDPIVRAHVGIALGKLGATSAVKALLVGLEDKESMVARSSAIALGLLTQASDTKTVNKMIRYATSASDRGVRNFSLVALGEIGGAKARAFLLRKLNSGNGADQAYAALALGVAGFKHQESAYEAGRALLRTWNSTKSTQQRGAIAIALGLIDFEPAQETLRSVLAKGGDPVLKGHVCTALGLMNDTNAIPQIQALMSFRGDPEVRKRAAIALGMLRDRSAVSVLKDVILASSNSKAILGAATVAMGFIGDKSALPILTGFVENKDGKFHNVTRAFAAVALGFLGDKASIPLLSKIHENSNYLAPTNGLAELLTIL